MNLTIVGTGYVGLVTGACFAEMGNNVTCIDIDEAKLAQLREGIVPIHEPGLEALVHDNLKAGRLNFSNDLGNAINDCKVTFIAVGTPPKEDGSADLSYVEAVARSIGETMVNPLVVVNKSTVPVGTGDKVHATIDAAIKAARDHSVEPIGPVVAIDQGPNRGSRVAYLRDPDGITIEFIEKA